jgi:hypothetical protein
LKRISDKKKIPIFLKSKRYDEFYNNFSVRKLAYEIQERQNTFININDIFDNNYIQHITNDNIEKEVFVSVKRYIIKNGERREITQQPKTPEQIIEDDKKFYLRMIEGFTEPRFQEHPTLGKILNRKRPLEIFPKEIWDTRPYIQPIKEISDDMLTDARYALRQDVEEYEKYPAVSINLDFSDDVIVTDLKKHLVKLRKKLNQRPSLLPPKEFISKFKNYRTLQVIDILLWQKLTDNHIEYETLASFLFPNGNYSGATVRETFIPFAKKLLDSKSKESAYLCYLSDKD